MASVNSCTNAGAFRAIQRDLLITWLRPWAPYFERRGLTLPALESERSVDYDKLAGVFLEPTPDMPAELVDSAFLIHGMASSAGMDILLEGAAKRGRSLEVGAKDTPADVAVRMWLVDPRLLEDLHNYRELGRRRTFRWYATDTNPVPAFVGPTETQAAALEERLNRFYVAWHHGKGAKVSSYKRGGEWCFLVRHGARLERLGAMEDGVETSVLFRRLRHDVLLYKVNRGQMGVYCCAEKERGLLLRVFGSCLFGRADFFPGTSKYTLWPLLKYGRDCLACSDVPGIERVSLTGLELRSKVKGERELREGPDVFGLIERKEMRWPVDLREITRATFTVKFWRAKKPRRVSIVPSNKVVYGRDGDAALLEPWMEARGFVEADWKN